MCNLGIPDDGDESYDAWKDEQVIEEIERNIEMENE